MILPSCRLLCCLSYYWNPAQSGSECRKEDDLHAACPYSRKHKQSLRIQVLFARLGGHDDEAV